MQATTNDAPCLVEMLPQHRLDESRVRVWVARHVPGFGEFVALRQFQGGQSNPTYLVEGSGRSCVLRKKPPGVLLASAHAVEREFRILGALAPTPVPVPEVFGLCEDPKVLGAAFYAMEFVHGRVFTDPTLGACNPAERTPLYEELARTLSALHSVDWRRGGLADYGRAENYLARQMRRWSQQYAASGVASEDMDRLIAWLGAHLPATDAEGAECTIAHGDYRIGNVMFDGTAPRAVAVLDWELSTIGHPLADVAYSCLAWRLPVTTAGLEGLADPCFPDERRYLDAYRAGMPALCFDAFEYFVAFALFRWAAILAGVYRRALDGNAADARGIDAGRRFHIVAALGWSTASAA